MHSNAPSELRRKMRKTIIATEALPDVVLCDSDEDVSDESNEYYPSSDR